MTAPESIFHQTPAGRLHALQTGKSALPIVMIHGAMDAAICWSNYLEHFSTQRTAVALDLPGHGQSARVEPCTELDLAGAISSFLERAGLLPCCLLGHSLGASVAAAVAARQGNLVRALILIDPPWTAAGKPPKPAPIDTRWQKQLVSLPLDAALALAAEKQPNWEPETRKNWVMARRQADPALDSCIPLLPPWMKILPSLYSTLLVITGDPALGARILPEVENDILAFKPGSQVVRLANAGHYAHFDQPAEALAAITQMMPQALGPATR